MIGNMDERCAFCHCFRLLGARNQEHGSSKTSFVTAVHYGRAYIYIRRCFFSENEEAQRTGIVLLWVQEYHVCPPAILCQNPRVENYKVVLCLDRVYPQAGYFLVQIPNHSEKMCTEYSDVVRQGIELYSEQSDMVRKSPCRHNTLFVTSSSTRLSAGIRYSIQSYQIYWF